MPPSIDTTERAGEDAGPVPEPELEMGVLAEGFFAAADADNDGYALDPHFACELVGALEARDSTYVVAAPMLYESKADGSLAAHATQTKLRWQDGYVRHDHSIARALNRGRDFPEGDQTDFLEDHGFVVITVAFRRGGGEGDVGRHRKGFPIRGAECPGLQRLQGGGPK